jgi:hypothetical protein
MKIAIDLNDVYRAYTSQFADVYTKHKDRGFDYESADIWTHDLRHSFSFTSKVDYLDFLYDDFPYEIFGCAPQMQKGLSEKINKWIVETAELDIDEDVDFCIVSTNEYGKSIGSSLFFISKYALCARDIHMLMNAEDVWGKCDVLITANPDLISNVPDGKIVIKIDASYNQMCQSKFSYSTLSEAIDDKDLIDKLIKTTKEK